MAFQNMLLNLTFDDLEHQGQGYQNFKYKYLKKLMEQF